MNKPLHLDNNSVLVLFLFTLCLGSLSLIAQKNPRTYTAHETLDKITIDGIQDEAPWQKAKWSQPFIDIEGEKIPNYETRMKMIWDANNLYIYAELKEPHVWGTLKQKDTVVFYNNDFEVFIDPDGDTHDYYELEINALNTIWDLYLSKPYRNKGHVLNNWDINGLHSAVHVNGTLNNPNDLDVGWSVEIAIPWSFTTGPIGTTKVPKNEFWRINFSRVNWDFDLTDGRYSRKKDANGNYLPEYNWVWSPQGVINMHEPEHWGYVHFSTAADETGIDFEIPKDEHIKWYLYELYRDYRDTNKGKLVWKQTDHHYTTEPKVVLGAIISPVLETNNFGFHLWAVSPFTGDKLVIHTDGRFESIEKVQR